MFFFLSSYKLDGSINGRTHGLNSWAEKVPNDPCMIFAWNVNGFLVSPQVIVLSMLFALSCNKIVRRVLRFCLQKASVGFSSLLVGQVPPLLFS